MTTLFVPTDLSFKKRIDTNYTVSDAYEEALSIEKNSRDKIANLSTLRHTVMDNNATPLLNGAMMSEHAFNQLCSLYGVPAPYFKKLLAEGNPATAKAYRHQMDYWKYERNEDEGMLRFTDGNLRGIVSSSYSTFDDTKLLKIVNKSVENFGLAVSNSLVSPDFTKLRLVSTDKININGDDLSWGIDIQNSRVGRSSVMVQFFLYRWICSNGMMFGGGKSTTFKHIHRGTINTESLTNLLSHTDDFITWVKGYVENGMATKVDQNLLDKIMEDFKLVYSSKATSEKVLNIYNEKYSDNVWGIANAFTEVAQDFEVINRTAIEQFAGKVMKIAN